MPRYATPKIATLFSLCLLAACSGAEPAGKIEGSGYESYAADNAVSQAKLKQTVAAFFEQPELDETRAIVVMHGGRVVAERYAPGYGPDSRLISWSMAKSVTGTLIGFMVADGLLVLDDPAPVPEWANPGDERRKITLRQLLQMSSGIDHSEGAGEDKAIYEADTPRMLFLDGRENVARYAESRTLEAAPGSKFEYSTPTSHILADIMTRTLTDSRDPLVRRDVMLDYARGRLFEPLGMTSAMPEFDRNGTMLGGSMIHATARDWAKFGEFLRNNGSVKSAQLLPVSWVKFMRTPSANQPNYGAHIWLNRRAPADGPQVLFPDSGPGDVFAALGHLGQFIVVSPQNKLTIVRLGKTQDENLKPIDAQLSKLVSLFRVG